MSDGLAPAAFPRVIDSTMRADFVSCPHKFYRARIQGLAKSATNVHLHFGGCFAKGTEAYRRAYWGAGATEAQAFQAGYVAITKAWGNYEPEIPTNKTYEACIEALASYMQQYRPESDAFPPYVADGKAMVECTFALPIPVEHPDGGPVIYAGRYDALTQSRQGKMFAILDDKTTTRLGDSWIKQWYLRSQFTGYIWAAQQHDIDVSTVIVRGVAVLKTDITHAQAIEQRPHWQVDRWLIQLIRDVERMKRHWNEGVWDQALDHACAEYGGCTFIDLCTSPQPEKWEKNFVVNHWNPLAVPGEGA